jgi:polyisoprenyl-phosphate glycosyltransferase
MKNMNRIKQLESKQLFITCVVPIYNEASNIEAFIAELTEKVRVYTDRFEIIIVDDGSSDGSNSIIIDRIIPHNKQVKLITFSRNFGKESALTAGLNAASGDVVILIDADFQHPIDMIDTFLQEWKAGYDMVYGVIDSRKNESIMQRCFKGLFYWLMKHAGEISIPSHAGDFRLMDRSVVDALNACHERSRFMKGLYAWVGFKSKKINFSVEKRRSGTSSWHILRLANLALAGIVSFSDLPLRLCAVTGLILFIISGISVSYIVISTLITGAHLPGYPTLIAAITFFSGIQLLFLGVLGEYISCIFREVKKRPKYIISQKKGFEEDEVDNYK